MKKLLVTILLFMLLAPQAYSQLDKVNLYGGFVYEFITMSEKLHSPLVEPYQIVFPFYGFAIGADYALMHSDDQVALAVNTNVHFAFSFSNIYGTSLMFQAPVFLMVKYGAGATLFNEQKAGIGVGIGANYTYLYIQDPISTLNQGFVTPNVLVQVTMNNRGSTYTVRGHWSLAKATHEYRADQFLFSNFGVAIVYGF